MRDAASAASPYSPAAYPVLEGEGLVIRGWDGETIAAAAQWRDYPFPYQAFNVDHLRDPVRARELLDAVIHPGRHRHFVAIEGGEPVGRVSVNLEDPSGLYIWSVHVPPEHEGRGVCRRMLAVVIRWLESTYSGRTCLLNSAAYAEHAHRAYFALGFRITETIWRHDRELEEAMWRTSKAERSTIASHMRFINGHWEARTYVMRRRRGLPLNTSGSVPRL